MGSHGSEDVWSKIRRLFRQDELPSGSSGSRGASRTAAGQPPCPPREARRADPAFDRDLANRLGRAPARDFVLAGKINLLDVDAIRTRLGARWPALEERVHIIVRDTLRSRLDAKDLFTRYRDNTYLIVFSEANATEAKLKTLLIGREITTKLFGESEADRDSTVRVQTVVAKVNGEIARQSIDVTAALSDALTEAERTEIGAADADHDADHIGDSPLTQQQIQDLLGDAVQDIEALESYRGEPEDMVIVEDRAQQALRRLRDLEEALSADDKAWKTAPTSPKATAPMPGEAEPRASATIAWKGMTVDPARVVREYIDRGDREIARRKDPLVWIRDTQEPDPDVPAATFSYLPMWNSAQNRIALYLCHAALHVSGLGFASGALTEGSPDPVVIDTVDRLTLRQAKTALEDMTAKKRLNMISLPVHFSSLNRPSAREQYLRICHAIPEDLRRMLVWEVVRAPPGTWKLQLGRALAPLQRLGRATYLRIELDQSGFPMGLGYFEHLPAVGIRAVGLDLSAVTLSESAAVMSLTAIAKDSGPHGLACYAYGLSSPVLVKTAAQLRFEHLSGPAIARAADAPQGVIEKVFEDL
jgi:hypothetical protein